MTYQDILNEQKKNIEFKKNEEKKILELERKIEYHKKRINKIEGKCYSVEGILIPLVKEIQKRCGYEYFEIYGPFGMTCETSVYFSHEGTKQRKVWGDDNIDICKVDTWGLTLTPCGTCESGYKYWTGEQTNEYAKGTIGYYNGMNNVYKELPADIDEVIKLLRFTKGRKEEE